MPQNSSHKREIGGDNYEVFMLPPRVSMGMLVDLGKLFGPALESLKNDDGENSESVYLAVAGNLLSHIEKSTLNSVCDKLSEVTHVNGMPLNKVFDSHFMGKMGALMQWLMFALETQYSDFLGALGVASAPVPGETRE